MRILRPNRLLRFLSLGAAALLCGCDAVVLNPQGPVGIADKTIMIDSLAIMLAIVVPTIVATLGIAWWYRGSNQRARYLPTWAFSGSIVQSIQRLAANSA